MEHRFFQRKFDNYANQRNYGLSEIEYKHPWILMVDADEIVPPELVHEISMAIIRDSLDISLYRLRIKYFFMNKWLRHSSGYPTWYGRLVKKGHAAVEGSINEHCITSEKIGYLKNHLYHYPFNKGFHAWFEKHNRYSSMEADALANAGNYPLKFKDLFSDDPLNRRKAIKQVMYKLPGRPILMFLSLLFVKRGFLDGGAGITFCILRMIYEYMIDLKVKETKKRLCNKGKITV